ncbi:uncharacterized protein BJ171DRAFT_472711 [Polychytrium aggregatum]|uniref:uncharacterized protein n=1 Tax=Polychytrium aggregatum TaxID=110093 RepID=UPI0022FF23B3|nr:uncharacterized protein BJ171DRAFT_472711 [Polychytrium aggregatum]KAI9207306.1 hypothetical protein BJ171DRAFT_472711 [Polychytrium aggregatum]
MATSPAPAAQVRPKLDGRPTTTVVNFALSALIENPKSSTPSSAPLSTINIKNDSTTTNPPLPTKSTKQATETPPPEPHTIPAPVGAQQPADSHAAGAKPALPHRPKSGTPQRSEVPRASRPKNAKASKPKSPPAGGEAPSPKSPGQSKPPSRPGSQSPVHPAPTPVPNDRSNVNPKPHRIPKPKTASRTALSSGDSKPPQSDSETERKSKDTISSPDAPKSRKGSASKFPRGKNAHPAGLIRRQTSRSMPGLGISANDMADEESTPIEPARPAHPLETPVPGAETILGGQLRLKALSASIEGDKNMQHQLGLLSKSEHELTEACCDGDVDKVYSLLWKGVNVNVIKPVQGRTAANSGHSQVIKTLLQKKTLGSKDLGAKDNFGSTPLHFASVRNLSESVQALACGRNGGDMEPSPTTGTGYLTQVVSTSGFHDADNRVVLWLLPDEQINGGCNSTLTNNQGKKPSDLTTDQSIKALLLEEEHRIVRMEQNLARNERRKQKEKQDLMDKAARRPLSPEERRKLLMMQRADKAMVARSTSSLTGSVASPQPSRPVTSKGRVPSQELNKPLKREMKSAYGSKKTLGLYSISRQNVNTA